jgi:hypothetical protein
LVGAAAAVVVVVVNDGIESDFDFVFDGDDVSRDAADLIFLLDVDPEIMPQQLIVFVEDWPDEVGVVVVVVVVLIPLDNVPL